MKTAQNEIISKVVETISYGRERTNILKNYEQKLIALLVQSIPRWISSDLLTGIGFIGSLVVFLSFLFAKYINGVYLLFGVLGFIINWFGDSLDGRIAYYRRKPRKWYGLSLDLTTDWVGTILMGSGFILYANDTSKLIGFLFIVLYGWEIITTLIRYHITGKYSIDSGFIGPTEVRIIISAMLIFEVIFKGSLMYSSAIACATLLIANILDFKKLLKLANDRDRNEKAEGTEMPTMN